MNHEPDSYNPRSLAARLPSPYKTVAELVNDSDWVSAASACFNLAHVPPLFLHPFYFICIKCVQMVPKRTQISSKTPTRSVVVAYLELKSDCFRFALCRCEGRARGEKGPRCWRVMLAWSTCSCSPAWLFVSRWAASVSDLSGCQVQNWTLNLLPKNLLNVERRLHFVPPNVSSKGNFGVIELPLQTLGVAVKELQLLNSWGQSLPITERQQRNRFRKLGVGWWVFFTMQTGVLTFCVPGNETQLW